jgi:hypothetical protein
LSRLDQTGSLITREAGNHTPAEGLASGVREDHPAAATGSRPRPVPGPNGAEKASTKPASAATSDQAKPSPKCRCSIASPARVHDLGYVSGREQSAGRPFRDGSPSGAGRDHDRLRAEPQQFPRCVHDLGVEAVGVQEERGPVPGDQPRVESAESSAGTG